MLTRRNLCRIFMGALFLARVPKPAFSSIAPRLCVDQLLATTGLPLPDPLLRQYRADVVVTLLGVPMFSRKNVGGAVVALRESIDGTRKLVALRFAGGANPQRTHGFKYDGSLEEVILESGSAPAQAAYFGFVTSSTNENFDDARKRVLSDQKPHDAFIAAEGVHVPGSARCEKGSISLPGPARDLDELSEKIRASFPEAKRAVAELHIPGNASTTFLYSVRAALRAREPRTSISYVHNAKPYRLECERASDPHRGASTRITGRIHDLTSHQVTTFRLWLDDPSSLPWRIEFQPRSYLRISLEHEPEGANRAEET